MSSIEKAQLPAAFTESSFVDAMRQLDNVLDIAAEIDLGQAADLQRRVYLLEQVAKRIKAGDEALSKIAETQMRLSRRAGQLLPDDAKDRVIVAATVGISVNHAHRFKSVARFEDEIFEKALRDMVESGIPTIDSLVHRCKTYATPSGMNYGNGWRDPWARFHRHALGEWDEQYESEYFREQVALAVQNELSSGEPVSITELATRVIGADPELIIGLDPPGLEVMRKRLTALRRTPRKGGWPAIFTCLNGDRSEFTYVDFAHATLGHAKADLSIKRENLLRVLAAYRSLRRLIRNYDGLPDSTPLRELATDGES